MRLADLFFIYFTYQVGTLSVCIKVPILRFSIQGNRYYIGTK